MHGGESFEVVALMMTRKKLLRLLSPYVDGERQRSLVPLGLSKGEELAALLGHPAFGPQKNGSLGLPFAYENAIQADVVDDHAVRQSMDLELNATVESVALDPQLATDHFAGA